MKTQTLAQIEAALTATALEEQDAQPGVEMTNEQIAMMAAGAAAFAAGEVVQADPHPRGSSKSGLWRGGWMGAARAATEASSLRKG